LLSSSIIVATGRIGVRKPKEEEAVFSKTAAVRIGLIVAIGGVSYVSYVLHAWVRTKSDPSAWLVALVAVLTLVYFCFLVSRVYTASFGNKVRLRRAQRWFNKNLPELLKTHPEEYIALLDADVMLAHGLDLGVVSREAYTSTRKRPIFIEKVEPQHDIVVPTIWKSS
jgi:hypothetical protein